MLKERRKTFLELLDFTNQDNSLQNNFSYHSQDYLVLDWSFNQSTCEAVEELSIIFLYHLLVFIGLTFAQYILSWMLPHQPSFTTHDRIVSHFPIVLVRTTFAGFQLAIVYKANHHLLEEAPDFHS